MQFFNSLTRRKETFQPKDPGRISLYVCGITAYDLCHIGHARAAVVFDVLVRFLRYRGFATVFIRNFTDVDDKIIKRALEENRSSEEVSRSYIEAFYEDMDRLDVLRADIEPKATEHIEDMQRLINKLLERQHAYVTPSGDVYFKVRSFPDYGRLSGRDIEELKSGVRIEPGEEKEDPLDFALWKRAKPEEPAWPSPWGEGRPGWHIECSAMSERYAELPLDIHAGGQDLIFPHHENERAQSMAASNREFVRYWLHNGFVRVRSEKMSKSLGNFITLRDIFGFFLPEVLRFFLLSTHYRSPLDFSWEALAEAEKALKRVYQTKDQLEQALSRSKWNKTALDRADREEAEKIFGQWEASLEDDLNTAAALGHVFSLARLTNRLLEDKGARQSEEGRELFQRSLDQIGTLGTILGLFQQESRAFLTSLRNSRAARRKIDVLKVEELLSQRQQARGEKNFDRADALREELSEMGVEVQDTPQGPVWDVE